MAISKEFQSAYQRWEMTSFDARPARAEPAPAAAQAPAMPAMPAGIQPPTVEELEAIHIQAHEEGYAEGLAAGQQAGQVGPRLGSHVAPRWWGGRAPRTSSR